MQLWMGVFLNHPNLIIVGDLNFTLSDAKILGWKSCLDPLASYFSQLLVRTRMVDLPPVSLGPTWQNGRIGVEGISKWVDRFLASDLMLPLFSR